VAKWSGHLAGRSVAPGRCVAREGFPAVAATRGCAPTLVPMLHATRDAHAAPAGSDVAPAVARHLRQVLLWPLRLVSTAPDDSEQRRAPWRLLRDLGDASPWREQLDEFTGDALGGRGIGAGAQEDENISFDHGVGRIGARFLESAHPVGGKGPLVRQGA